MTRTDISWLIERKALFVTGKGGIGKTLTACALGQYAASLGKKVCIVESSAEDQVAPVFGHPPIGHNLTLLRENLYAINLNSHDNFRDFIIKHLGFERLFEKVFNQSLVKSLLSFLPGLAEITLLGRMYYMAELAKDPAFDFIIYDGFASGHFYNLLSTPHAIINSGLVGPAVEETEKIISFYGSAENCATLYVTIPEPLVISEYLDFLPKLQQTKLAPVIAVGMNRYRSNGAVLEDLKALEKYRSDLGAAAKFLIPKIEACHRQVYEMQKRPMPLLCFNDVGAPEEPLPEQFFRDFFAAPAGAVKPS